MTSLMLGRARHSQIAVENAAGAGVEMATSHRSGGLADDHGRGIRLRVSFRGHLRACPEAASCNVAATSAGVSRSVGAVGTVIIRRTPRAEKAMA